MFSWGTPVTKGSAERLALYQQQHPGRDVPTVEDLSNRGDAGVAVLLRDVLPRYSTPEQAKAVYPAPPEALVASSTAAAARKRTRHGALPSSSLLQEGQKKQQAQDQAAASTLASSGPVCVFQEGVERVDYMGRSFLETPPIVLEHAEESKARACHPPKTLRGAFQVPRPSSAAGEAKPAGIQQLRWASPAYGHLLFAADLKGVARLWSTAAARQPLATFTAHVQPIKSMQVTQDAALLSTGSVDGTIAIWDVEAGLCQHRLENSEGLPVLQHHHHPHDEAHLLLAALGPKVVLYDVRISATKYQREYTGHLGNIFNLTLLSGGGKLLTTAEDKTLRTWDFRSPVQIKQFADAGMHAISHVVHHPTQPHYLAAQSLDNRVVVFEDEGAGKLKLLHDQEYTGHTISGTACQLSFSHDGRYLSSGDISGNLFVWEWETKRLVKSFKAHAQMLVSHLWHPIEPTRVVTAAWDGQVKNWI